MKPPPRSDVPPRQQRNRDRPAKPCERTCSTPDFNRHPRRFRGYDRPRLEGEACPDLATIGNLIATESERAASVRAAAAAANIFHGVYRGLSRVSGAGKRRIHSGAPVTEDAAPISTGGSRSRRHPAWWLRLPPRSSDRGAAGIGQDHAWIAVPPRGRAAGRAGVSTSPWRRASVSLSRWRTGTAGP